MTARAEPAARSAIPELCRLHGLKRTTILSWSGRLPEPGHYLRSTGPRTRFAYRVVVIEPAPRGRKYAAKAALERIPIGDLPHGARVHDWYWSSRG